MSRKQFTLTEAIRARRETLPRRQAIVGGRFASLTLADAILDHLVHNSHRIGLTGESIRKKRLPIVPENTEA